MGRAFRPALLAGVAAVSVLVSGCTAPRPVVTFYGNRTSAVAQADFWCTVDTAALTVSCPPEPDNSKDANLTMTAGQPLQINVPSEIGDTPWVVVFQYRDGAGKSQSGRTEIFTDSRLSFTLPSLGAGAQLSRVEVQAGLVPTQDAGGAAAITASRTWVLIVNSKVPAGS